MIVILGDHRVTDDYYVLSTAKLRLEPGDRETLDLELPSGAIEVTVVDDVTGQAIPGARATAGPNDRKAARDRYAGFVFSPGWGAFADKEGKALLRALPESMTHSVRAGAEGYENATAEIVPGPDDAPAAVRVRLRKKR